MGRQDFETETLIPVIGGSFSSDALAINNDRRASADDTAYALRGGAHGQQMIAHSLRAEGFDASEDGTGRGTPLVPVAIQEDNQNGVCLRDTTGSIRANAPGTQPGGTLVGVAIPILEVGKGTTSRGAGPNGCGIGTEGDPMFTLQAGAQHAVASPIPIDMRQASRGAMMTNNRDDDACSGGAPGTGIGEADDPAPTISQTHTPVIAFDEAQITRKANRTRAEVGLPASTLSKQSRMNIAFKESQSGCRTGDVHATLDANKGSRRVEGVMNGMAVRRLTPLECERLQGFPDCYTRIPMDRATRKAVNDDFATYLREQHGRTYPDAPPLSDDEIRTLAADGPRYRALGNSMAVPVLRWIGERIAAVDAILADARGERVA